MLFHTIWKVVDSHWQCINQPDIVPFLNEYLWSLGFDIPVTITYCLAQNARYKLNYRVHGGQINVFINNLL